MRIDWDDYFLEIAKIVSKRSTCLRRQVGALLVRDNYIISTGYNGAPKDETHCEIIGCIREKQNITSGERHELCRGVHAEQNAIIQAALRGVSINDAILYCTHKPCNICKKMLYNAGIYEFIYLTEYPQKKEGSKTNETP